MTRPQIQLIYCAYDGILTQSVFDSQVITPLALLKKTQQVDITLIAFETPFVYLKKRCALQNKRQQIQSKYHIQSYFYPRIPRFPGLKITAWLIRVMGSRWLKSKLQAGPVIFQGRGVKGTYIGCYLRKCIPELKVIYDIRDKEPEQYLFNL